MTPRTTLDKLPQYYADDVEGASPFMPFIVAPLGASQDTLVLGPQSVAQIHDKFIDSLYHHTGSHKIAGIAARAFLFRSKMCVAVLLPTDLKDEGGRSGLIVSIGFFVKGRYLRTRSAILADYLKIFMQIINRQFSMSLPTSGADRLAQVVRLAQEGGSQNKESLLKLQIAMDLLLLASTTVGELSRKAPWWSKLPSLKPRRRLAKTIYYQPGSDYGEVLDIFLKELCQGLEGLGRTGVQQILDTADEGRGLMTLIPFTDSIADARAIKLGKCRGKSYLKIY